MDLTTTPHLATSSFAKTKLVLIMDDNAFSRSSVAAWVGSLGYMVRTVSSAKEAVECLRQTVVDVLLLHVVMPAPVYGAILAQIAESTKLAQIPIIVSNAFHDKSTEADAVQMRYAGKLAISWLPRPFRPEALQAVLDSTFAKERNTFLAQQALSAQALLNQRVSESAAGIPWKRVLAGLGVAATVLFLMYYRMTYARYHHQIEVRHHQSEESSRQYEASMDQILAAQSQH